LTKNIGGIEFEISERVDKKGKVSGSIITYGKDSANYTNIGTTRTDAIARIIRTYYQTDSLPNENNEREFETLKKIQESRTAQNIGQDKLGKIIHESLGKREFALNTTPEKITSRIKVLYPITKLIFPPINKEKSKITSREKPVETKVTTESRKDFETDPKIIEWMSDSSTGIANKSTKAKNSTIGSLYKVFQLLKLDGSHEFELAGGAQSPEEKTKWLKNQFEKIVKPYYLSEWALDPTDNKFKQKLPSWKGGVGSHYKAIMAARSFASFVGFPLAKIKSRTDPLYAGVRSHGLHDQIEIPVKDIDTIQTELKKLCEKEGNMDAYMYFMVGMATGMRKMEGLTIPLKQKYIIEVGKFDKSAKEYEGIPFYEIRLFNRKVLHTVDSKEEAYTTSNIYDPVTCKLIFDRMNSKEGKEQGLLIGSLKKGDKNNFIKPTLKLTKGSKEREKQATNSPLGYDKWLAANPVLNYEQLAEHEENPADVGQNIQRELNKPLREAYIAAKLIPELTREENMEIVKEAVFSYKGKEFVFEEFIDFPEKNQKEFVNDGGTWLARDKINEQTQEPLKQQKFASGYDERNYFWAKPLHSVRHAFAQFWLQNSEYNFAWVAEHGHWKTIEELKQSYGGIPKDKFREQSLVFVEQAAKSQNRELGIDKTQFNRAVDKVKEEDEKRESQEKAVETEDTEEDENE